MSYCNTLPFRASLLGVALLQCAFGASAQDTADGAQRATRIEEMLVTARRVSEDIQSVPTAISAIGTEDVAGLRIEGFQTVGQTIPNLYVNKQGGSPAAPQMNLRGVSNGSLNLQVDSGIGLYVDGVYLSRSGAAAFEMADLERIEVMRGPQGTLFGRNSTGGAINLITARPSGEAGVRVDGGLGNFDERRYKVVVDTPEWNGLSARLVAGHSEYEGDVDNIASRRTYHLPAPFGTHTTKARGGDSDTDNVFLAVHYAGNERLTLDYKFDSTDWKGTMPTRQMNGSLGACVDFDNTPAQCIIGYGLVTPVHPYPGKFGYRDELAASVESTASNDVEGHSFTAEYAFSDTIRAKYLFGHRKYDLDAGANEVYGGAEYIDTGALGNPGGAYAPLIAFRVEEQEQDSHELQLIGSHPSLDWIVGAFLYDEQGSVNNPILLSRSIADGDQVPVNVAAFDYFIGQDVDVDNESRAVYAHATWHLGRFDLSGGVRYTEDDREEFIRAAGFYGLFVPGNHRSRYEGDHTDYDIALTYQLNDSANVYAKYATGYVSGGTLLGNPFREDEMELYEAGLKSDLLDDTLRLNVAVFRQERTDVQQEDFDASAGGYIMGRGDEIVSDGLEVEVTWIPLTGLTLDGAWGYTDVDASGDLRTWQPENTLYLGAQYDFVPLAGGVAPTLRVDVSWRDDAYRLICPAGTSTVPGTDTCVGTPDKALDDLSVMEAVARVGARLDFANIRLGDNATGRFGIWGQNLLDEDEMEFIFSLGGPTVTATYMRPRTYGVDFSVQF
ncbi:MAG: Vitamin B12 transporter BtuB [Pseudomonadales bacterium]|nr:Vitamin B12 transporter BtuB [Pseudomonadales bacterium]